MPLKIIRQDITKIECDAIVNPSNRFLKPGGGADLAIHTAAGPELLEYCQKLGGCEVGKAKITPAFNLPCKYIIHTAGPKWYYVKSPKQILASCYRESLNLALTHNCETVAFPLIGSGAYGCPRADVLRIATMVISDFLFEHEMLVYLVVYDESAFNISRKVFSDVSSYIDNNYVDSQQKLQNCLPQCFSRSEGSAGSEKRFCADAMVAKSAVPCAAPTCLDEMIKNMDKCFADTLFYYIDKKGITDVECYKRSNVDKKTFSKIKCNKDYKPSKITAVSFVIGLKLDLNDASHLLRTAGYSLSNSNVFDVIIQYFVTTGKYDNIFDVNEVLYSFDQVTLGV